MSNGWGSSTTAVTKWDCEVKTASVHFNSRVRVNESALVLFQEVLMSSDTHVASCGVWQCAFIDRDKRWGDCVLVSETLLQSTDEVLTSFSLAGIDSLRPAVFIIPLKAALAHIAVVSERKLSWSSPSHKEFAVSPQKELSDINANTSCVPRWPRNEWRTA